MTTSLKLKLICLSTTIALFCSVPAFANAEQIRIDGYKCLDDTGWSRSAGTHLQIWDCTGGSNQQWNQLSLGNNNYLFQNRYSGLCLDKRGNSNANFTPAIQYPCNANDAAQVMDLVIPGWAGILPGHNPYSEGVPINAYYGNCLDDPYDHFNNGNKVEFYQCNGTQAQDWWGPFA